MSQSQPTPDEKEEQACLIQPTPDENAWLNHPRHDSYTYVMFLCCF